MWTNISVTIFSLSDHKYHGYAFFSGLRTNISVTIFSLSDHKYHNFDAFFLVLGYSDLTFLYAEIQSSGI
jgi:hypothetical protein